MRITRVMGALAASLTLVLAPTPAPAEHHESAAEEDARQPWNPETMTELSGQLARAMREVRSAYRREPGFRDPSSPNRRAAARMDQILQALARSCTQLHNRVKGGGGFEETQGIARKIGTQLNDADVEGRRIMTSAWLDEKLRPAMVLINQIAPFYGSGPLFDPDTLQRLDRPPNPGRSRAPE